MREQISSPLDHYNTSYDPRSSTFFSSKMRKILVQIPVVGLEDWYWLDVFQSEMSAISLFMVGDFCLSGLDWSLICSQGDPFFFFFIICNQILPTIILYTLII